MEERVVISPARAAGLRYETEIEGITALAEFSRLDDAVSAVWNSVRALPIGHTQYAAYEVFFGDGAVDRVQDLFKRHGEVRLSFRLCDRSHSIVIRPSRRR
ncbi:hypothetical protein ACGFX4_19975 [Kitasatospora sp. NPDC048365]|uniref:hypothetical protein n=1 Tax=Kitasatospora sp. NPDC048365 TaxID=3364050 RepID=UPI0037199314